MTTKQEWVAEIESLDQGGRISDLAMHLKSPQFTYGNWRICVEHKKNWNFRTVVLGWRRLDANIPAGYEDWDYCPRSDQEKGWNYRLRLMPHGLPVLLSQLDSLARPGRALAQCSGAG